MYMSMRSKVAFLISRTKKKRKRRGGSENNKGICKKEKGNTFSYSPVHCQGDTSSKRGKKKRHRSKWYRNDIIEKGSNE
jgi:hypothetical protein